MKRYAVTVPVLNWWPLAFSDAASVSGFAIDSYIHFLPLRILATVLGSWNTYSLGRHWLAKGKPVTLAIGTAEKPAEIPTAPEKRNPLAFPPQENQCFVCGNYDQHRQDVFGDASHATCREWLGDWKAPRWLIGYEERYSSGGYRTGSGHLAYVQRTGFYNNNVADLSGFQTRQQVIDYCHKKLEGYLDKGLTAEMELPDGQTIRFNIPVPEKPVPEPVPGETNVPIDPGVARAFYNNEGISVTGFLKGY